MNGWQSLEQDSRRARLAKKGKKETVAAAATESKSETEEAK